MATRQKSLATRSTKVVGGARAVVSKTRSPSVRSRTKPHASNGNPAQASIERRCPVVAVLRDVASAMRATGDLDLYRNKAFRGFTCGVTALGLRPMVHQRIRAMERLAMTMSATSEVGACWQMLLGYQEACHVQGVLEDEPWEWIDIKTTDLSLRLKNDLQAAQQRLRNCLFSSAYILVRRLNDPDLNQIWESHCACMSDEEEREGACVSGVIAAAGAA